MRFYSMLNSEKARKKRMIENFFALCEFSNEILYKKIAVFYTMKILKAIKRNRVSSFNEYSAD